jgi:hypothetical protein
MEDNAGGKTSCEREPGKAVGIAVVHGGVKFVTGGTLTHEPAFSNAAFEQTARQRRRYRPFSAKPGGLHATLK